MSFGIRDPGETSLPTVQLPSPPSFHFHLPHPLRKGINGTRPRGPTPRRAHFPISSAFLREEEPFGIYGLNPQPCIATDCSVTDAERLGFFFFL